MAHLVHVFIGVLHSFSTASDFRVGFGSTCRRGLLARNGGSLTLAPARGSGLLAMPAILANLDVLCQYLLP